LPTVVVDHDHSASSRDLARRLAATGFYDVEGEVPETADVEAALRRGEARVGLVIPADFARDQNRPGGAQVELVVDGSDPQTVGSATATAAGLVAAMSAERLAGRGPGPGISVVPQILYNPDQRTAIYIVPGLVGVILTMTMVMHTSMASARARERGTLEQLIVSPVRPLELMLGKILPYVTIGYVQITVILLVGWLAFGVPVIGSLGLLYLVSAVFIVANLALGLFFSTLARTQQQAMQMSYFFLLPNILLSGFMFPWEGMPAVARGISQALPLTHYLRIVRAIALKGGGAAEVAHETLWLGAILVVLVALASLRFRKKLG
jgi:ABC-2 type transport system permease protein